MFKRKKPKKENNSIEIRLGTLIRQRRRDLGISGQRLAEHTGMSAIRLSTMETGDVLVKNKQKIRTMCEMLCDDGMIYTLWFMLANNLKFDPEYEEEAINFLKQALSLETRE